MFVSVSPRRSNSSSRAAREEVREIRNFAVKNSIFILDMDYLAFSESKSSDLFKYINISKKIFGPFFSIFALFLVICYCKTVFFSRASYFRVFVYTMS